MKQLNLVGKHAVGKLKYALVDDEDYEKCSSFRWWIVYSRVDLYYVQTSIKSKKVYLHRFIMNQNDPSIKIDHKNHDTLDNQKSNLRLCSNTQNVCNKTSAKNSSSRYLGVRLLSNGRFVANINQNRTNKHLGCYIQEEEAAQAYDIAALYYYGEFANLNFPQNIEYYKTQTPFNIKKSSKYRGVYWNSKRKTWNVSIVKDKQSFFLGSFLEERDAAKAYDIKYFELYNDTKRMNFPDLFEEYENANCRS